MKRTLSFMVLAIMIVLSSSLVLADEGVTTDGNITASFFKGSGITLSGVCLSNGTLCTALNPFDQPLNTIDNVTFWNVTSNGFFIGDGSLLTGLEFNPWTNDSVNVFLKANAPQNVTMGGNFTASNLITQNTLMFEDSGNASTIAIDGDEHGASGLDSSFIFFNNESDEEGIVVHAFQRMDGTPISLWQSGKNHSANFIRNSLFISSNFDIKNATILTDCFELADLNNITLRSNCDTPTEGANLIVSGMAQIHGELTLDDGIFSNGTADFFMDGINNFEIVNGTLHPRRFRQEEIFLSGGEDLTVVADFENGLLFPFVNTEPAPASRNWLVVSDPECNGNLCARSQGGNSNNQRIMRAFDINTTNFLGLNMTFELVTNEASLDVFNISANNNEGSGEIFVFNHTGTTALTTFQINFSNALFGHRQNSTLSFYHSGDTISDQAWVDNISVTATPNDTVQVNVTRTDTIIELGDGSIEFIYNDTEKTVKITNGSIVSTIWPLNESATPTTFVSLTDTPATMSGQQLKTLRVNGAGSAIEFINFPISAQDWSETLDLDPNSNAHDPILSVDDQINFRNTNSFINSPANGNMFIGAGNITLLDFFHAVGSNYQVYTNTAAFVAQAANAGGLFFMSAPNRFEWTATNGVSIMNLTASSTNPDLTVGRHISTGSQGAISIGNNTLVGLARGDLNVSTVYYSALVAKSPVITCSEKGYMKYCKADILETQETYWFNVTVDFEITSNRGNLPQEVLNKIDEMSEDKTNYKSWTAEVDVCEVRFEVGGYSQEYSYTSLEEYIASNNRGACTFREEAANDNCKAIDPMTKYKNNQGCIADEEVICNSIQWNFWNNNQCRTNDYIECELNPVKENMTWVYNGQSRNGSCDFDSKKECRHRGDGYRWDEENQACTYSEEQANEDARLACERKGVRWIWDGVECVKLQ